MVLGATQVSANLSFLLATGWTVVSCAAPELHPMPRTQPRPMALRHYSKCCAVWCPIII